MMAYFVETRTPHKVTGNIAKVMYVAKCLMSLLQPLNFTWIGSFHIDGLGLDDRFLQKFTCNGMHMFISPLHFLR